jgi:CRISPR-associated endonuclease/helicase Cas3
LFRGYGVSPNAAAVHAGLIANDSLIFLDEAHCSRAFAQTLRAIRRYRSDAWREDAMGLPFQVVEMTATPTEPSGCVSFQIDSQDRSDKLLGRRINTAKRARLLEVAAKPSDSETIAKQLVAEAAKFVGDGELRRHAIIANRIATAKEVAADLRKRFREVGADPTKDDSDTVTLMIGRMRPIDRDDQLGALGAFRTDSPRSLEAPRFLVSTQCIEVGADLDFDSLTTECASIDALVQRFGRLDRLGSLAGKSRAAVLMPMKAMGAKMPDPVYGRALEHTWEWRQRTMRAILLPNCFTNSIKSRRMPFAESGQTRRT